MFTGLIEDVGKVYRSEFRKECASLTLTTDLPLKEIQPGASVAVNGACLTVVDKPEGRILVEVSSETLERTTFKKIRRGDEVNLERPLRLKDRLGGHLVTGHVEGVAVIEQIRKSGRFSSFFFRVPEALCPFLVSKGSVALDGISLTVNECSDSRLSVVIIPYTLSHTNLRRRRVGDKVNIETDILGKYVQRLMGSWDKNKTSILKI
ncbi:MAG: riboflavin synthase [Deltaproteobacteria bacterium]|nr:riboflavin synthase [Deltaproteobacteria bacterium]